MDKPLKCSSLRLTWSNLCISNINLAVLWRMKNGAKLEGATPVRRWL